MWMLSLSVFVADPLGVVQASKDILLPSSLTF